MTYEPTLHRYNKYVRSRDGPTNVNESTAADSTLSHFAPGDPTAVRPPVPSSPCLRLAGVKVQQTGEGWRESRSNYPDETFLRRTKLHGGFHGD